MYGKSYWYGREVEGRLSDIETVFVRGQVPTNYKDYPHIYFTIEYIEMCCVHGNWKEIHDILETKQFVTIEANSSTMSKIPMSLIGIRVRFMTLKKSNLDNHEAGSIATIITEKPILLLNQISSQNSRNRSKHQLENGDQVRICTRPVKDSVLGDNLIGIHFNEQVWSISNSNDCRCGNCGNYFEILPDPPAKCECGTDPYDPGEQQCTIM